MTKASTLRNKATIASSPCGPNGSRKSCAKRLVSRFHPALSFVLPHHLQPSTGLTEYTGLDTTTHQGCLLRWPGAASLEKRPEAGHEKGVGKEVCGVWYGFFGVWSGFRGFFFGWWFLFGLGWFVLFFLLHDTSHVLTFLVTTKTCE